MPDQDPTEKTFESRATTRNLREPKDQGEHDTRFTRAFSNVAEKVGQTPQGSRAFKLAAADSAGCHRPACVKPIAPRS